MFKVIIWIVVIVVVLLMIIGFLGLVVDFFTGGSSNVSRNPFENDYCNSCTHQMHRRLSYTPTNCWKNQQGEVVSPNGNCKHRKGMMYY